MYAQKRVVNRIGWSLLFSLLKVSIVARVVSGDVALPVGVGPAPMGFPVAWDGDKYFNATCPTYVSIPSWLNGYFFVQTCGSYGSQTDPVGNKLTHMFDGIGALAVFQFGDGKVHFSAKYYPTAPFKIWDSNGRNLKRSQVAWKAFFSPYNRTAAKIWKKLTNELYPLSPNMGFWKIGHSIVAGTETIRVGMTFDLPSFDNFRMYPFRDKSDVFRNIGQVTPLVMAIHERVDSNSGTLWAATTGIDFTRYESYIIVFSVAANGSRQLEGVFNFGIFDPTACEDRHYRGDNTGLVGYMHSITSTQNYVILPISSAVLNPCVFDAPPKSFKGMVYPSLEMLTFDPNVPLRFLVFDKRTKQFFRQPFFYSPGLFITHQFNAYEASDGSIVADMIGYTAFSYASLHVDRLVSGSADALPNSHVMRFVLNVSNGTVRSSYLIPPKQAVEFSQFNHAYEERPYKYGYAVVNPFFTGSHILKLNMNDPSQNLTFVPPGGSVSLSEPWFIASPDARDEDDGVLLVRGLDVDIAKTILFIVDAKSMNLVGFTVAPTIVPFGFHNRFYSSIELGLLSSMAANVVTGYTIWFLFLFALLFSFFYS